MLAHGTLCRRSELAALVFEDLEIAADNWAPFTYREAYTDQHGEGQLRVVLPDAMRHLQTWPCCMGRTASGTPPPLAVKD